jgi:hypothetical protein
MTNETMTNETMTNEPAPPAVDYTMTSYVSADAFMVAVQMPLEGGAIVLGEGDPATHYVKAGQIVARPANTAALAGMTLQDLPVPCTITIDGTAHDCTDDHCDLEFTQPGTCSVTVSAFPMLDATFEVTQP